MNNKFDELTKSMTQSVTRRAALKKFSLGPVGNTIVGLIGGGVGEQILSAMGLLPSGGGGLVGNIGGSAVGGAILMAIVGAIKNAMASKP